MTADTTVWMGVGMKIGVIAWMTVVGQVMTATTAATTTTAATATTTSTVINVHMLYLRVNLVGG